MKDEDLMARARRAARDPKEAARYALQEERMTIAARSWLAEHPDARPVLKSELPIELVVASVSDADRAGVLVANAEGRALLAAMVVVEPDPTKEPTIGMVVRALDAARRVRA